MQFGTNTIGIGANCNNRSCGARGRPRGSPRGSPRPHFLREGMYAIVFYATILFCATVFYAHVFYATVFYAMVLFYATVC